MNTKQSQRTVPKVYLIDDDPVATFLLVDLVESVDLPYAVFENAVKFMAQPELEYLEGCIISDVRMPGMSGLELQDALHKRGVNLPIIFISAYADVRSVVQAMRGGALDFFQKPFPSQPAYRSRPGRPAPRPRARRTAGQEPSDRRAYRPVDAARGRKSCRASSKAS